MTSAADTTQHPDVSEISDLAEGLLPPSRTADVRRHLDSCGLCADVRTSLEEIRSLLGTLPGAARMPADIAERIDAALAAEALLDATAPQTSAHVSRETVSATPAAPAGSASPVTRRTVPAGAPGDRPASRSPASSGPGRGLSSWRRRRHTLLGAVCGLAAIGLGVLLFQSVRPDEHSSTAEQQADTAAVGTQAPRFSGTVLTEKVRYLLAPDESAEQGKTPRIQGGAETEQEPGNALKSTDDQVPACIREGIGRSEQPLAGERGDYEGRPAYLVLLPHSGDLTRVDVYIVDASCSASGGTGSTDVLVRQSYPRP